MFQCWCDLTFLHWRYPPESVRPHLPPALELDTFDGSAWVPSPQSAAAASAFPALDFAFSRDQLPDVRARDGWPTRCVVLLARCGPPGRRGRRAIRLWPAVRVVANACRTEEKPDRLRERAAVAGHTRRHALRGRAGRGGD